MPNRLGRSDWAARKREALHGSNLVFLDPDNGLGLETEKHATYAEIRRLRRPGRSLVFITFPGRSMKHNDQVKHLHARLVEEGDASSVATLRTNVSVPRAEGSNAYVQRQRWFTIVDPDSILIDRAQRFAEALASVPRVRASLDQSL